MAARPENIVVVPGSTVATDFEHIDRCDSCDGESSSSRECGRPYETYYTLYRGNMYSVGDSALVLKPLLYTPRLITCLDTGEWTFEPIHVFCSACHDCTDIQESGYTETGVYFVNETFYFLCTFDDSGDAWLTFQKRLDGSVNFYNNWIDYLNGFGFMKSEFWFGLERLHWILSLFPGQYELRVDLELFNGTSYYAIYSSFDLTNADDNYRLIIGGYTGTAGDSLTYHNGMQFTTNDRDNDNDTSNCAVNYHGAWWYRHCHASNLNGRYYPSGESLDIYAEHIHWISLTGLHVSLRTTKMMIRRRMPYN